MESRFDFLEERFPKLAVYGRKAEEALNNDNNICLLNLGRIAEDIIKTLCESSSITTDSTNEDLAHELLDSEIIDENIYIKLSTLIEIKDEAVNDACDSEIAGTRLLTTAQELCEWFMINHSEGAFSFLADLFPPDRPVPPLANLSEIGQEAEENLFSNTRYCLICLGDIGEGIVDFLMRENSIDTNERDQIYRINKLSEAYIIGEGVKDTLHALRMARNKAVHERYDNNYISEDEGKKLLEQALDLCVWLFRIVMKPGYIVKARMIDQDDENINVLIGTIPAVVPLSEVDGEEYTTGMKYIFKVMDKEGEKITLSPKQADQDYNLSISQLYSKYEIGQDLHVYIKRIIHSVGVIVETKDQLEAKIPPYEIGRRLYDYDENNKKQIRYEATARVKFFDWTQYPPMLLSLRDIEREKRKERRKAKEWENSKRRRKSRRQDLEFIALCKSGTFEQVIQALDEGANPDSRNNNKTTALMTAAQYNKDKRVIEALIDAGADVNAKNQKGNTALMFAAMHNSYEVVKVLLDKGANIEAVNNEKKDALTYARVNKNLNNTDVIRFLSGESSPQKESEKHKYTGNMNRNLLLACKKGSLEDAKRFVEAGADVNALSHNHSTPLIIASQFGDIELVRFLLDNNADVTLKNNSGNTALHIAVGYNDSEVVTALINAGADVNAVNEKGRSVIDILNHKSRLKGSDAWKALMKPVLQKKFLKLCMSGSESEISEAVNAGVNVNARNKTLSTALMFAAKHNTPEAVEILTRAGAYVDSQDIYGNTALIYAVSYNSEEVVNVLLEAGADPAITNISGFKASDYAKKNYRLADSEVLTRLI